MVVCSVKIKHFLGVNYLKYFFRFIYCIKCSKTFKVILILFVLPTIIFVASDLNLKIRCL
jgi:hypothetical protein